MPLPGTWSLVTLLVWSLGYTLAQSVTGQVVTVVTTSTATALSDCTCTQTVSRPLTQHELSTISRPDVTTVSSEKPADPTFVSTAGRATDLPSTRRLIILIRSFYRLHVTHLPIRTHSFGLSDSHCEPDIHPAFPSAYRLYLGMPTTSFMPARPGNPEWQM